MGVITILLGMIFILYYIAGVRYAGYRVSGLWIWLVAGLLLAVWGGCRIGCKIAGIPFFVPGAVVVILRVCILAGLGMFFYLEYQIGTGMKAQGVENLDYIIVLGCQVKGTKPSRALKDRLDTAKEYLRANPETIAILSGGQGKLEEISEAECMCRYLVNAGISKERLLMEAKSTTTRQNLRFSRKYMDYQHDEVGIITNNFHVDRGVLLAKRYGYQRVCGIAAPCKSVLLYHYRVREAFALAREMLHKR